MKRGFILLTILMVFAPFIYAGSCDLEVSLLNQDPYPAVPGEKLEVVFTISNIDSIECGTIFFEILEEYPFSVDPGIQKSYTFQSGTFTKDYNTQKTIPIDYTVNENALDGDIPLEVRYKSSNNVGYLSKTFDINVEDVKVDFEVFVSDYNYLTKEIKFEVLNVGESDVEAVTVEVAKQNGIKIYGTNKENIGDLSSNEDTSSEFKLDVNTNKIKLIVSYSDSIQVRRILEKNVDFDASLFEESKESDETSYWKWIIGGVVIVIVLYFWRRQSKKKK